MKEYDIYLPVLPDKAKELTRLKKRFAKFFGGLTFFPHKNEGVWKLGGVTFRDDVVVLRVLASDAKRAEKFLRRIKTQIEQDFDQEEVLMIGRTVEVIR